MPDFNVDLSDIEDFADVNLADASDYADQTGPAPLAPGNYRLRVEDGGRRVNQSGEPIDDHGYPQFQLSKLTVLEPVEDGREPRSIYPFQTYSLRPVQGGQRKGSVPVVDLLRGYDDSLTFENGKEALTLLAQAIANGGTFVASTNWLAKDSDYIREQIDAAGGDLEDMNPEERKKLFKAAFFRGQKAFPKVNGVYVPEVVGPSGAVLEARVTIGRIYPSSKTVKKMGPFTAKKVSAPVAVAA